jgi:hypothetical protein
MGSRIAKYTAFGLVLMITSALGQGSIFGLVQNADLSTPLSGEISFFGFINDSDDEIRTNFVDGAGYESGNWFDDFQNYQSESPGLPYDYYYFNLANLETGRLSGFIPNNSFQQENVVLDGLSFPVQADNLTAEPVYGVGIRLTWYQEFGYSYHVYRRVAPSNGSFFRIDNPLGHRSDPGVSSGEYIDTNIDSVSTYEYVLISETDPGGYSPPSVVVSANSFCVANECSSCCLGIRGNVNNDPDEKVTILDVTYLISYLFGVPNGPAPFCTQEANVNGDPDEKVTILDITYLISYLFGVPSGPPPPACP